MQLDSLRPYIFIVSFLCIPFIPFFGVIDTIGLQWFYLSLLNIILIINNLRRVDFYFFVNSFFKLNIVRIFSVFYFFVCLSLIYTDNIRISIVDFSRISIVLLSIFNFIFFHFKSGFNFILFSKCILLILFFELIYAFLPLVDYLLSNSFYDLDFNKLSYALKGFTGNKNVMASFIAFKVPIIFYLIINSKGFIKFFSSFIFSASLILIFLLASRAAYLSTLLVLIILYASCLFFNFSKFKQSFFYLITPILSLILLYNIVSHINTVENISSKTTSFTIIDESSNNRLELYSNALDYITQNPFIGCGIGNWKIESLPYWKALKTGYTVPYHAHNDFLELATEIGVIGGLFYFLIFLAIFFYSFKCYIGNKDFTFIIIFCMCIIYFFDAMLNFPLERTLNQINFVILFSIFSLKFISDEK